ncbi:hypothetical protein A8135_11200 [Legionella jamestowniensis]|uniref:Carbon-nitrogen hydrolase n=1 Tax=Legionella jamestowniensis TaxID=455 RepID=A0ABX2XVH5_9GAMM|nr:hypothetical protein [Legionella jamestowniensis]OCH98642.1 hypothetical protein A8135_11200 [Legionella jamestowniensis]
MFRSYVFSEAVNQAGNQGNIKVFTFQPEEAFYFYPFEKRLQILEERIQLAKKSLNENAGKAETAWLDKKQAKPRFAMTRTKFFKKNLSQVVQEKCKPTSMPQPSAIFVAPEYLFKDFSELCYKRYYSQQQKKTFKRKLTELSLDTNMLLVPGTICWYKKAKVNQENYYRNTAYFFYQGRIQKYIKKNPHTTFDFDFVDEGFLNPLDFRRRYFKANEKESSVKDFGIKIGIEICYDSIQGELFNFIRKNNVKIDMQLIIADGAKKPVLVQQEGLFYVKLERNREDTKIGTIVINEQDNQTVEIKPALPLACIEEDLMCFQFK